MASSDDEDCYLLDDVSEDDHAIEENACDDEDPGRESKKDYVLETEDDLRKRQDDATAKISELLSVPPGSAAVLLRHCQWDPEQLQDKWFSDSRGIRDAVGLPASGGAVNKVNDRRRVCAICFVRHRRGQMRSAGCSHYYCLECWRGHVHAAIGEGGPRCLSLRCPDPPCPTAVVRELVDEVADDEARKRYAAFVFRSFVEEGKHGSIRWCPGPGCARAVRSLVGSELREASCACRHSFCFRCGEEAHRPATCAIARAWAAKNSADGASATWVLLHAKQCPACRGAIQKKHGCNHMTCRCQHEFCWICLEPWHGHGGDGYTCNRYVEQAPGLDRRQAEASLKRYAHYYERWTANGASRGKAREDLDDLVGAGGLDAFAVAVGKPPATKQMDFLKEAYEQILESRGVLRWTYAYVYYLDGSAKKREFCEFIQGEAEMSLEALHHCAERERIDLCQLTDAAMTFEEYRSKLAGLTAVTRNYFRKLVTMFEDGMAEVQV